MKSDQKSDLETLTQEQVSFYNEQGYLLLENHIDMSVIEGLREEIARIEKTAYGMTASDDKLDLEDSHTPDAPRIRRIKLPHTQSDFVCDMLYSDAILAPVRDLIGANIRLHTTKLNMKSAGYGAPIDWHQDFAFYPHTNDDVLAVAVIIDDMRSENGPLKVFSGSHKGPIFDHHVDGVFAGGMSLEDNGESHHYANLCFAYGAISSPPPALVSTIKIKQAGFTETHNTEASFCQWLSVLRDRRFIP